MKLSKTVFFLGLFGASCGLTRADDIDAYRTFKLDPAMVKVTGMEQPLRSVAAAVTSVDQRLIQEGSVQLSINEALATVPGVFALNPYNFAQDSRIAIRGFGARSNFGIRGIRLIVDGIPATLPDGQAGVDGIDLGSAASFEIIRGPAGAIYGPASGGVIRIETEEATGDPFLETRVTRGDYGLFRSQFKSGFSEGAWNVLVSASYLEYDGYRENSRTENRSVNAKLGYTFENGGELTTVINLIDYPVQDDPGGLNAAEVAEDRRQARDRNLLFDGGESVRQEKLGVTYEHPVSDLGELQLHGFFVQRDFANKLPFAGGGQVEFDRLYTGAGAKYVHTGEQFRFLLGGELGQQVDDRRRFDNLDGLRGPTALDQEEDVLNLGSVFSADFSITEAVTLSGAIRYDEVRFEVDDRFIFDGDDGGSVTFRETSPMAGISWALSDEISVYANLATSFETPTTTELDNPAGGGFNADLEAQNARSFEIGVRGQLADAIAQPSFEISLFSIDVEDALVPFELEAFPDREFFRNAGSTEKRGVEAAVDLRLMPSLVASLSYTYSDFAYERFVTDDSDFSRNRLPGVPEHFANLRLGYKHSSGFGAIWNTRYVGALQANDANTEEIGGYAVSDLRFLWQRDYENWAVELFAGVNNVFDREYSANIRINAFGGRYFEPAPDRNAYGGIRLRYLWGD